MADRQPDGSGGVGGVLTGHGGDEQPAGGYGRVGAEPFVEFGFLPGGLHPDQHRVVEPGRAVQGVVAVEFLGDAAGGFAFSAGRRGVA